MSLPKETEPLQKRMIIPAYDGFLADRIQWNQTELDRVSTLADIRKTIVIRANSQRPETNYSALGDTMILKGIAPIRFPLKTEESKFLSVEADFKAPSSTIYIHDWLLQNRIQEQSSGSFDGMSYAAKLNKLVNKGIYQALADEKTRQMAGACVSGGFFVGIPVLLGCDFTKFSVVDIISSRQYGLGSLEGGIGLTMFAASGLFYYCLRQNDGLQIEPYMESLKDINPFKHMKDLLSVSHSLKRGKNRFLDYKETPL